MNICFIFNRTERRRKIWNFNSSI